MTSKPQSLKTSKPHTVMKHLSILLLLSMLTSIGVAQPMGEAPIKNPMLWADVPDPDVIRVGDTF